MDNPSGAQIHDIMTRRAAADKVATADRVRRHVATVADGQAGLGLVTSLRALAADARHAADAPGLDWGTREARECGADLADSFVTVARAASGEAAALQGAPVEDVAGPWCGARAIGAVTAVAALQAEIGRREAAGQWGGLGEWVARTGAEFRRRAAETIGQERIAWEAADDALGLIGWLAWEVAREGPTQAAVAMAGGR
jgi:hypothetical protein